MKLLETYLLNKEEEVKEVKTNEVALIHMETVEFITKERVGIV